jgi:hypothetical protein
MTSRPTARDTTITALYRDRDTAQRRVQELEAAGVERSRIDLRSEQTEGGSPEERASAGAPDRTTGAVFDFLLPELDRRFYATGLQSGGTMVILRGVPAELEARAVEILDQDAEDMNREGGTEPGEDDAEPEEGIVTQAGSDAGSATGAFDRLTGERIGGSKRRPRIYRAE